MHKSNEKKDKSLLSALENLNNKIDKLKKELKKALGIKE